MRPEETAEFNRRYKEGGGCPCWVQVSLHDGHCCFDVVHPDVCAEHEEKMLAVMKWVHEPNIEGVRVGDFFVCSWGYDQTNIDFYRCVGLTAKRIKVQKWSSKRDDDLRLVPGDGPKTYSETTLDPDEFYEADYWTRRENEVEVPAPVRLKTVQTYSDRPCFTVSSYANAYLWDGVSAADTTTAGGAGH